MLHGKIGGAEIVVHLGVGPGPVLLEGKPRDRNRQNGNAAGILGGGGAGGGGALDDGGDAIDRERVGGAHRLEVVELAADHGPRVGVGGGGGRGGEAGHADAVGLHAGESGIGVAGDRAGAGHIGGQLVVERGVADVRDHGAALEGGVEHGAAGLEGLPAERGGAGAEVAPAVFVPAREAGIDPVDARGERLIDEHAVEIDREAPRAAVVEACGEVGEVAELTALAREVDDAGGVGVAVGDAPGPAGDLDALGVVGVLRGVGREAVLELAHGRQAAEIDLVAGAGADGRADLEVVVVDVVGADGEVGGLEEVGDAEIGEELGVEDGDRVGEVGERLVGARAAHRGGGFVADVGVGGDLESRERDGSFF